MRTHFRAQEPAAGRVRVPFRGQSEEKTTGAKCRGGNCSTRHDGGKRQERGVKNTQLKPGCKYPSGPVNDCPFLRNTASLANFRGCRDTVVAGRGFYGVR